MELVDFLRARLDEEAELAEAASPGPWGVNAESDEVLAVDGITVADGFALSGHQLRATTAHIARHDPARVLAEVEAKRRIVNLHRANRNPRPDGITNLDCITCGGEDRLSPSWPCPTIRYVALPYASHPDYRGFWRP